MLNWGKRKIFNTHNRRKLASNFFSLSFIQAANYLIPLVILPYIVRIIGPEKFGLLSYAQTFAYYFTIIVNYSFDYTATREINLHQDNKEMISKIYSSVFYCKIILFVTATLIFAIVVFTVDQFSKDIGVYTITYLINVGFVFFPSWFFQGIQKLTKTALFNFISKFLFALLVVLLIRKEEDFFLYALSNSIAQVVAGLGAFYGLRYYQIRIIAISYQDLVNYFKGGLSIFFSNIAISLYTTTNLIILGFFTSETEYGYFSAALKIALVTHSMVILPMGMTLFPHIGNSMHRSEMEGIQLIKKYLKLISVITLAIGVLLFIFAEDLIHLIFGNEFIQGAVYLRIMAFMPFVSGLNNLVSVQGLLNLKMDKEFFFITFITFALSMMLNIILVPSFHGIGTSVIQLSSELCMTLLAGYYLIRKNRLIEETASKKN